MKKLAIAAAGAVLACVAVAPSATAAETSTAGAQTFYDCGFVPAYKTPANRALYNHCGTGPVKIIVENVWFQDKERCVSVGLTDIEYYSGGYTTRDSWHIGNC